jgi:hypothetical protein
MTEEDLLDHDAVARVLRRASLMAEADEPSMSAGLQPAALLAAADEVGLPPAVVRRSIAVERLGQRPARRLGDRVLGASVIAVDGEIGDEADTVLERVDAWLVDGHHLRRDRLRQGRGEWSKRAGPLGAVVRAVRTATGEGRLGDVRRVHAAALDTGDGSCVIRVSADRARERRVLAGGGSIVAAAGTTTAAVAAATVAPVLIVGAPVAIGVGVVVAASGRRRARRTTTELERLVESVQDGTHPTRLALDLARRVAGRRRRPIIVRGRT